MANEKALIPLADYDDACDAIREKLFEEDTYLSSELGAKIRSIAQPGLLQKWDREFDPYDLDLNTMPEDVQGTWTRPATWPNLDSITLGQEEIYLTYRNTNAEDFISLRVYCTSDTYNVDIGTITDGAFTPLVTQTQVTQNTNFNKAYDSTLPNYVVVKLSVESGAYITQYGFERILGADGTTYITGYNNSCVERYTYLPHWIGCASVSNCKLSAYIIVHEYHKGITTTCVNLQSLCAYEEQLRKVQFVSCDFSAVINFNSMFYCCRILQEIDFRNTNLEDNTNNINNMNSMFGYCRGLKNIYFDEDVVLKPTAASGIFTCCTSIETLNLEWLDLSIVTTIANFLDSCWNLKEVTFNENPIACVTAVNSMFASCYNLQEIDMPTITSSAITTCVRMFQNCNQLESIDLKGMPTPNCTLFNDMFYNCYRLTSVKFTTFQPIKATTLADMFYECWSLTDIDLGSDASKHSAPVCTTVQYMFYGCQSLESLTLDGLDLQAIVGINGMFANCYNLEYLSLKDLHLTKCTSLTYLGTVYSPMFLSCYSLKEVHLDGMNPGATSGFYYRTSSTATNYSDIFYDSRYLDTITFNDVTSSTLTSLAWLGTNTEKTRCNIRVFEAKNLACTNASFGLGGLFSNAYNLLKVDFTGSTSTKPTSITTMFAECWSLQEVKGMNDFDYSLCTSSYQTFYNCKSIKSVDLHSANLTATTRMDGFFAYCYSLESADLSNFNVGTTCTNLNGMFNNCYSLREITFNSLVGSAVTNWGSMFYNCRNLTSITWPYISTAAAENFSSMFSGCWALTDVSFANFTTSKVTTYANMFTDCRSIEELDLHQFTLPSTCTSLYYMFSGCWNLKSVDITAMTYGGVTTATAMFYNCWSLQEVTMPNLTLSNCTNVTNMFCNCLALRYVDVSHLSLSKVTNNSSMFSGCDNMTSIDMRQVTWSAMTAASNWWPSTHTLTYLRPGKLYYAINLSGCNCLTHDNLVEILTDLPTAASASTALKLGNDNYARLTESERTIGKNWVVSI